MNHKLHEQIEKIMDEFDFDRVRELMVASKWKWATGEDDEKVVPNGNEIRREAWRMLKQTVNENQAMINSGGFTVIKLNDTLYLFFGVDSTSIEFADNDNI
jgi:hypothetical protein